MFSSFFKSKRVGVSGLVLSFALLFAVIASYPFASASSITGGSPVISENYIRGVEENLSCSQFRSTYSESLHGSSYSLYSSSGKYISSSNVNHIVSTGDYIVDGKDAKYTIVVTGDIDGDGVIGITDTAAIKLHFAKTITLENANFQAADNNNDNRVTATDYLRLKYHIQNKYNIHENESYEPDDTTTSESDNSFDESDWTSGWM